MSLESDVYAASCLVRKERIKNLTKYYRIFYHIYQFTTENLDAYFTKLNFKDKDILTTGSSADQILNAISLDCKSVTCFDLNPFVKYYYELKEAAIKSLEYEEYIKFFSISNLAGDRRKIYLSDGLNINTYYKVEPYLSDCARDFWNNLFFSFDIEDVKKELFFPSKFSISEVKKANTYLNKNNYYKLREKLNVATVDFITCDIKDLNKKIIRKYDYIILSNLLQYVKYFNCKDGLKRLKIFLLQLETKLNENGEICVCYLYNYTKKMSDNDNYCSQINETYKTLGENKIYYIKIPSMPKKLPFALKKDAVLMYKKNDNKVYKKDYL